MKFDFTTEKMQSETLENTDNEKNESSGDMPIRGQEKIDVLQAALYNSANKLIHELEKENAIKQDNRESYQDVVKSLQDLKTFHYNVGFAGEQSCGKSTVINSLIEYPLMPTCNLTTTCVSTKLVYGEIIRIVVNDDDTKKKVLDLECGKLGKEHIRKLKEYACAVMPVSIIENLQYFTDKNIFEDSNVKVKDLVYFDDKNPKHIAVLVLVLLTVYVGQNNSKMKAKEKAVNDKRQQVLTFFGFPAETLNYSVQIQWDCELLKCGMVITDLPGLGALAAEREIEGKVLKSHDNITIEAIQACDSMTFLVDETVKNAGTAALKEMLSSAKLKDVVNKGERIIPVLNKADRLNGVAHVNSTISNMLSLLESANVQKKQEDIRLYSAIAGEYAYKDIPFEQTIYSRKNFKKQYDVMHDEYVDMGITDDEVIRKKILSSMNKKLGKDFEKSGIEELLQFFRLTYIEKGKYEHTKTAVLAMRRLLLDIVAPLEALVENYEAMSHLAGDVIDRLLSKELEDDIRAPLSKAIERTSNTEVNLELSKVIIDSIPMEYSTMFKNALKEYKERNLEIVKDFSLFLFSARVDQKDSENYKLYQKLLKQCDHMTFDIAAVNKKYMLVLQAITKEIENIYEHALSVLKELQRDYPDKLQMTFESYEQKCDGNEDIRRSLEALKKTLITYVNKQIDAIEDGMKSSQDELTDAGNQTVAAIIRFNTDIVEKYTDSVVSQVKNAIHGGIVFSSRDYLLIEGEGGMKELFEKLSLSQPDAEYIEREVRDIGVINITNHLDKWIEDAKNRVQYPFNSLDKQIRKLIRDTADSLKGMADGSHNAGQETQSLLEFVENAMNEFKKEVQNAYDQVVEKTDDAILQQYKEDIFKGIVA